MCVSLLGDGVFLVAMAWQVYELSNAPTALSLVGIAMTVPTIIFLLVGGVASDRFDRGERSWWPRTFCAALAVGVLAALALGRRARAVARRDPCRPVRRRARPSSRPRSTPSCPRSCRPSSSPRPTRSTSSCARSSLRMAGPAVGGILIAAVGVGAGVRARRASFLLLRALLLLIRAPAAPAQPGSASVARDLAEGLRFVRGQCGSGRRSRARPSPTCCFMGPVEVLLPFLVKNDLGRQRPRPRHGVRRRRHRLRRVRGRDGPARTSRGATSASCTSTWTLATLAVAGYGLSSALWQLMLASVAFNALETAGTIVWATRSSARAARHAGPRLEPRLAHLDRPAAAVLRPHRPGERRDRRSRHAGRARA